MARFRQEFEVIENALNTRYKSIKDIGSVKEFVLSLQDVFLRDCKCAPYLMNLLPLRKRLQFHDASGTKLRQMRRIHIYTAMGYKERFSMESNASRGLKLTQNFLSIVCTFLILSG